MLSFSIKKGIILAFISLNFEGEERRALLSGNRSVLFLSSKQIKPFFGIRGWNFILKEINGPHISMHDILHSKERRLFNPYYFAIYNIEIKIMTPSLTSL